jgi:hypothetical protein
MRPWLTARSTTTTTPGGIAGPVSTRRRRCRTRRGPTNAARYRSSRTCRSRRTCRVRRRLRVSSRTTTRRATSRTGGTTTSRARSGRRSLRRHRLRRDGPVRSVLGRVGTVRRRGRPLVLRSGRRRTAVPTGAVRRRRAARSLRRRPAATGMPVTDTPPMEWAATARSSSRRRVLRSVCNHRKRRVPRTTMSKSHPAATSRARAPSRSGATNLHAAPNHPAARSLSNARSLFGGRRVRG